MKFFWIFYLLVSWFGCVFSLYVQRTPRSFIIPRETGQQLQGDVYGLRIDMPNVTYDKAEKVTPDKTVTVTKSKTTEVSTSTRSTVEEQIIQGNDKHENPSTIAQRKLATTLYFKSKTRVLRVDRSEFDVTIKCQVFKDRSGTEEIGLNALHTSDDALNGLLIACGQMKRSKNNKRKKRQFDVIYPGTNWCGIGTVAEKYDDLGEYVEADKCCRDHDHCPKGIGPFETKYGLFNAALWYKSHCKCDEEFYSCLKTANTATSNSVGNMYFNIISPQCIKKEFPEVCVKYGLFGICTKYKKDKSQRKVWTFKDNQLTY